MTAGTDDTPMTSYQAGEEPLTVTLQSTGKQAEFSLSELIELRDRSYELINESRYRLQRNRLAHLDPAHLGLHQVDFNRALGSGTADAFYRTPEGFGTWPYGAPLLGFGLARGQHRRRPRADLLEEDQWFLTLSGDTGLSFGSAAWDDRDGFESLVHRLTTVTADELAVEAALTHNCHWPSLSSEIPETAAHLLSTAREHDPLNIHDLHSRFATDHLEATPILVVDPALMRFVEVPQLIAVRVPWGCRVSDIDVVIRRHGLSPVRTTGKRTAWTFRGTRDVRLAVSKPHSKHFNSIHKNALSLIALTHWNNETEAFEHTNQDWENPHGIVNRTPLTPSEHQSLST